MNNITKKQILFSIIFIILGLATLQIPLTHLAGTKATFTVFDSFAPISGGFLGGFLGVLTVLIMELVNFFLKAGHTFDLGSVLRFFSILFAAFYFARPRKLNWIIPILAMMVFIINPVGRQVWYFSLYWLIPIICYFFQERFLLARSLGATFTAHAVGGALWITFLHIPQAVWIGLIPVVAIERLLFALGMALSYVLVNNLIAFLMKINLVPITWPVDSKYVWFNLNNESTKT